MAVDNEVQTIKYQGRQYTFRYWASAEQWVPVNCDGSLRSSRVPKKVWRALRQWLDDGKPRKAKP